MWLLIFRREQWEAKAHRGHIFKQYPESTRRTLLKPKCESMNSFTTSTFQLLIVVPPTCLVKTKFDKIIVNLPLLYV